MTPLYTWECVEPIIGKFKMKAGRVHLATIIEYDYRYHWQSVLPYVSGCNGFTDLAECKVYVERVHTEWLGKVLEGSE